MQTRSGVSIAQDEELVRLALVGGASGVAAFDTLLNKHRSWVFQRCLWRLNNADDAQDATQEVLVRVLRNLASFQGRAQFRSWLRTIVDNQCNTMAVRRGKYICVEHIEALIDLFESQPASIPADIHAMDTATAVSNAMSQLPNTAREVLRLRFFDDLSLQEIARALDLSLSAAKMRLYRALELFRSIYLAAEHPDTRSHDGICAA